jgi:hypothetical protein
MSIEIWDYLQNEFVLLNRLIEKHSPLIEAARTKVPDEYHISTLGAMLQSFYGGIENLFKRIALDVDGEFSKSDSWHKNLLDRMAAPFKDRPAVISDDLRIRLHKYLDFRHVFRSVYAYDLNWNKMRELVYDCEKTLQLLQTEMAIFKAAIKSQKRKIV